jgi:hypothetical protein
MADGGDLAPQEASSAAQTSNIVHSETTHAVQAQTVSGGVHYYASAPSLSSRTRWSLLALGVVLVLGVGAIALRLWLPVTPPNSAESQDGQGGGPQVTNPQLGPAVVEPCALVPPNEVKDLYKQDLLPTEDRVPDLPVDGQDPDALKNATVRRMCAYPLNNAGELRIQLVSVTNPADTKAVLERFRQATDAPVPGCADECWRASGRFVARTGTHVPQLVDVPLDNAGQRDVSFEALGRRALEKL